MENIQNKVNCIINYIYIYIIIIRYTYNYLFLGSWTTPYVYPSYPPPIPLWAIGINGQDAFCRCKNGQDVFCRCRCINGQDAFCRFVICLMSHIMNFLIDETLIPALFLILL